MTFFLDDLRKAAHEALDKACKQSKLGQFGPVLKLYTAAHGWADIDIPAAAFDSGHSRDRLAVANRAMVIASGAKAAMMLSEANWWHSTPEGLRLAPGELQKFCETRGNDEAVKRGWMTYKDILMVQAQTEQDVLILQCEILARGPDNVPLHFDDPTETWHLQENFGGRQKLYGEPDLKSFDDPEQALKTLKWVARMMTEITKEADPE